MSSLDSKIAANKSKNESIQNELEELKKGLGLVLSGNIKFGGDGLQACLVFQQIHRYFTNNLLPILDILLNGSLRIV